MTAQGWTASPGSDAAIALGCKCPVLDNSHGRGWYGRESVYVISETCEVHAARAAIAKAEGSAK